MTGIVLAGGENRRMGTDKAFLLFEGRPLVERVIAVLKDVCSSVIVVTHSPERYRGFGVIAVTDALPLRGPLTGIYTGIGASKDDHHLVVACDMPFLDRGLLRYLEAQVGGYDAVVPRVNGMLEPLHAVYHRRLLPAMEARLRKDSRRIQDIFDGARVRVITEEEIDRFDPRRRSFINLNTPGEYQEATCSDSECRN